VVVAADSPRIVQPAQPRRARPVLTRTDHASGSDRLAEACDLLGLAGDDRGGQRAGRRAADRPGADRRRGQLLQARPDASMSTAAHAIDSLEDFTNPNVVKVVLDAGGMALYFSRAPIPWWRDGFALVAGQHPAREPRRCAISASTATGRASCAVSRAAAGPLELAEALEQLRAMWHGHRIAVHVTARRPAPAWTRRKTWNACARCSGP
jgi:3-deoxy-manno-octulosonate cytidylyltransferase (CMP-KDO synthetase)